MINKEIFPGSLSVLSQELLNTYRFASKKINYSQLLKVTALGLMFATGASSAVGSTHNWMKTDFFENTKKGGTFSPLVSSDKLKK